jgi:hypothetical protein
MWSADEWREGNTKNKHAVVAIVDSLVLIYAQLGASQSVVLAWW